ncbi:MAG: hypothetical protein V9G10_16185 [Candidatus Nanopelagicales bacterium]
MIPLRDVDVQRPVLALLQLGLIGHLDPGLDRARPVAGEEHPVQRAAVHQFLG